MSVGAAAGAPLPAADSLPVTPRATWMFRLIRGVVGPVLRLVVDFRLEGGDRLPPGPLVIIANHLNWPDPWALLALLPVEPRIHFLANPANLVRHRVHWWFVRQVGGYIPVDLTRRAGPELFAHVDRCLAAGGRVAIFPEAAYGPREGELQAMKRGFAFIAASNGVPVVPVAISGTKELWLRKRVRVLVGEPVSTTGRDADAVFAAGRDALAALLPPYVEPAGRKYLRNFLTRLLY